MNVVLVPREELEKRGVYLDAEVLPDGRAILPMKAFKALSDFDNVSIMSQKKVRELKKEVINQVEPITDSTSEEVVEETTKEETEVDNE